MGNYQEIEGDLIKLALEGKFDVIAHGCNCFCRMRRGIAPQMAAAFGCNDKDKFLLENSGREGDINKLGQIQFKYYDLKVRKELIVVNAYTQYHWDSKVPQLSYDALALCFKKINHIFKGKHIGLPMIGAGLAGGHWEEIKYLIKKELYQCDVTVVIYKP